jgi:hypothetical protein
MFAHKPQYNVLPDTSDFKFICFFTASAATPRILACRPWFRATLLVILCRYHLSQLYLPVRKFCACEHSGAATMSPIGDHSAGLGYVPCRPAWKAAGEGVQVRTLC